MFPDSIQTDISNRRQSARRQIAAIRRIGIKYEYELWALAMFALVADVCLTYYGLQQGLTEANPVVRTAIQTSGFGAIGVLKAIAVGIGYVVWMQLPQSKRSIVPLALGVPWLAAAGINATVLLT